MFVRVSLVVEAVNHLKVRSYLLEGEVVRCDEKGVTSFQLLRHRRNESRAFLFAIDLLSWMALICGESQSRPVRPPLASTLRKSRRPCLDYSPSGSGHSTMSTCPQSMH
jgi:hypothetical protein